MSRRDIRAQRHAKELARHMGHDLLECDDCTPIPYHPDTGLPVVLAAESIEGMDDMLAFHEQRLMEEP